MTYQPHPLRFQLSRKRGYRKPEGGVVVSRPSKWGNPFSVSNTKYKPFNATITRYHCHGVFPEPGIAVELFRFWIQNVPEGLAVLESLHELRGKQLGCWCALDKPCHADILAELANPHPEAPMIEAKRTR